MAQDRPTRQQRSLATRTAIIEGAAAEFDERGYVGASMDGIAERIGMTKGALYFHFTSKADMAGAVVAEPGAPPRSSRSCGCARGSRSR
jgi:AcrR family transcriptional regulator